MQIPFTPTFTNSYELAGFDGEDLRNAFSPEKRKENLPVYNQVFADRFGFIPDLSIVDLLFNKGMEAKNYLLSISAVAK